jgi:hypothetical protein
MRDYLASLCRKYRLLKCRNKMGMGLIGLSFVGRIALFKTYQYKLQENVTTKKGHFS